MENPFSRTALFLGEEKMQILKNSSVLVLGVGGVGSFAVEAIARCGVSKIALLDNDHVSISNINRQIIALLSTVGKLKTEVMKNRILDINPDAKITCFNIFLNKDTISEIDFSKYDYIVDCIDTISAKIAVAKICYDKKIPIISSMGTGNKSDPTRFEIEDIYKTSVCPVARIMRRELKKIEVSKLKVLYSKEEPKKMVVVSKNGEDTHGKHPPASISYLPSVAGLIIASEVINDLTR